MTADIVDRFGLNRLALKDDCRQFGGVEGWVFSGLGVKGRVDKSKMNGF